LREENADLPSAVTLTVRPSARDLGRAQVQPYRVAARAASIPPASALADCDGRLSGVAMPAPLTVLRPVTGRPGEVVRAGRTDRV